MLPIESSAKAKVSEFYMTFAVKEDIVWLDIPVDEAHTVDRTYGHGQLRNIKFWKF